MFIQCRRLPVESRHDLTRETRASWVKGGSRRGGRDNFNLKLCWTIGLPTNLSSLIIMIQSTRSSSTLLAAPSDGLVRSKVSRIYSTLFRHLLKYSTPIIHVVSSQWPKSASESFRAGQKNMYRNIRDDKDFRRINAQAGPAGAGLCKSLQGTICLGRILQISK